MTDFDKIARDVETMRKLTEQDAFAKLVHSASAAAAQLSYPNKLHDLQSAAIPFTNFRRPPSPRELNEYQSAGVLMKRLADTISSWRTQAPKDVQPAILAILNGGIQINVTLLAEESFHGIRIEGTLNGSPCMLLSHQSSVQLLCYLAKVETEEKRRTIGFIIDGEETQV